MQDRDTALSNQRALLDGVATTYRRNSAQDDVMRKLCVRTFAPWLRQHQSALEVGCSDGKMTEMLAAHVREIDVVEATAFFLAEARKRNVPNATFHHAMIEQFEPDKKYDRIFATWILTHMVDAASALVHLRGLLAPGGLLLVTVPNVRVLSRQLALHMGLLSDLYGLSDNDRAHGHVRAYDRQRLNLEIRQAGFEPVEQGGLMLKILADYQMDALFDSKLLGDQHVEGFYRLGREYPDLCSAIYSVCRIAE